MIDGAALGWLREVSAAALTDSCRVLRDTEGVADDTFNTTTLTYEPPADDATEVYDGPCLLEPKRSLTPRPEGEAQVQRPEWYLSLPVDHEARYGDSAAVAVGDRVTVDSNPAATFRVDEIRTASAEALRVVVVSQRRLSEIGSGA